MYGRWSHSARAPSLFTNTVLWDVPVDLLRSNPTYMNFGTNRIWWGPSACVFLPGNRIRPVWTGPELGFSRLQYKLRHPDGDPRSTFNHAIFLNCISDFIWPLGKA